MKRALRAQPLLAGLLILISSALVSCGGGGGGATTPPPPAGPPKLKIANPLVNDGVQNQPYSSTYTSTGGTGALTWSVDTLPAGLSIDATTGTVSGIPQQVSFTTFTVSVHDSGSPQQSATLASGIAIYSQLSAAAPSSATLSVPYLGQISTGGGRSPIAVSTAGSVPPGLTVDASGRVSGTPTASGPFNFSVNLTDSARPPQTFSLPVTFTVDTKMTLISTPQQYGIVGRNYDDRFTVVNGVPPITWQTSVFPSNAGLQVDSAGKVTGVPIIPGSTFLSYTVSDSSTPQQLITGTVSVGIYDFLHFTSGLPPDGHVRSGYFGFSNVAGGVGGITWSVRSGNLPPGLVLSFPFFAGTPTQAGTYTFGLAAQDNATPPQTWNQLFTVNILPAQPFVAVTPLTDGVRGKAYSEQLYGTLGTNPYHWALNSGQLPAGTSISSDGLLSGTPQNPGSYSFEVKMTDSATPPQSAVGTYTWKVLQAALGRNDSIANATPLSDNLAASLSPYSDPVDIANPDTDYYKIIANAGSTVTVRVIANSIGMDPGLEIVDANGARYQTCQDPGDDSPPSIVVADSTPTAFDDECLNDDIVLGQDINSQLGFQVPGTPGTQKTFYAHVFDIRGDARPDMNYSINAIGTVFPLTVGGNLFEGIVNTTYDASLFATGGTGVSTFGLFGGTLPPGITLASNGTLHGTPTTNGNYNFVVRVRDAGSPAQVVDYPAVIVVAGAVAITPASLPQGSTGQNYNFTFNASGGTPPYKWTVGWDGQCCLLGDIGGSISGIPDKPGDYNVYAQVGDTLFQGDFKTFPLKIISGPLTVTTINPDTTHTGWDYYFQLLAKGGTPSFTWSLNGGNLPPGFALSPFGVLTGRATTAGSYTFSVKVTDSATPSVSTTASVTLNIVAGP